MRTVKAVQEDLRKFERETGMSMDDVSAEEILETIREDTYEIHVPRQIKVEMMFKVALEIAPRLLELDWMVWFAPERGAFVTSDNPFTVVPPPDHDRERGEYGLLTPGATSVLPLSSNVCLSFCRGQGGVLGGEIDAGFLDDVNYFVTANSDRFILASDEPLLRRVVQETSVDRWERASTIRSSAPEPEYNRV